MSQVEQSLCIDIINEHFGPIVSITANDLMVKGRQTLAQLLSIKSNTSDDTKKSLAILVQHRLVSYSIWSEKRRHVYYYQLEVVNVFTRLRFPFYILHTKNTLGEQHADIIEALLLNGKLNLKQIQDWCITDIKIIFELMDQKYVIQAYEKDSYTKTDVYMKKEQDERKRAGMPLTSAQSKKLKAKIVAERTMDDQLGQNTTFDESILSDPTLYFCVNYEQFHIYFRNQLVVDYARNYFNETCGIITETILNNVLSKTFIVQEKESFPISENNLDLLLSKAKVPLPIEGMCKNPLLEYLTMMCEGHIPLLRKAEELGNSQYTVDYSKISSMMVKQAIEHLIIQKFGNIAARIFRVVNAKQKIDEKQVAKIALVDEKTAKHMLYALFKQGLVFIQDVPKTIDHQASRTIFLYYTDLQKSAQLFLYDCYKTLYRLRLRIKKEYTIRNVLIEKSQRTDVVQGQAHLAPEELKILDELSAMDAKITVQCIRIDRLTFILRDSPIKV